MSGSKRRSAKGRVIVIMLAVGALTGGTVAARTIFGDETPNVFGGPPSVKRLSFATGTDARAVTVTSAPASTSAPETEPASATDALRAFLDAEAGQHAAVAFALLDARTQRSVGTPAAWQQQRANRLVASSFTIAEAQPRGDDVTVGVRASRQPSISPFSGFVPENDAETWLLVTEGGRWRVRGGRPLTSDPVLPSAGAARDTAQRWVERSSACDAGAAALDELDGVVLGVAGLRTRPCSSGASWRAEAPLDLNEVADISSFVAAYGPSVGQWARAVPVTAGDDSFVVVLAPLGASWRVMGFVLDLEGGR